MRTRMHHLRIKYLKVILEKIKSSFRKFRESVIRLLALKDLINASKRAMAMSRHSREL